MDFSSKLLVFALGASLCSNSVSRRDLPIDRFAGNCLITDATIGWKQKTVSCVIIFKSTIVTVLPALELQFLWRCWILNTTFNELSLSKNESFVQRNIKLSYLVSPLWGTKHQQVRKQIQQWPVFRPFTAKYNYKYWQFRALYGVRKLLVDSSKIKGELSWDLKPLPVKVWESYIQGFFNILFLYRGRLLKRWLSGHESSGSKRILNIVLSN